MRATTAIRRSPGTSPWRSSQSHHPASRYSSATALLTCPSASRSLGRTGSMSRDSPKNTSDHPIDRVEESKKGAASRRGPISRRRDPSTCPRALPGNAPRSRLSSSGRRRQAAASSRPPRAGSHPRRPCAQDDFTSSRGCRGPPPDPGSCPGSPRPPGGTGAPPRTHPWPGIRRCPPPIFNVRCRWMDHDDGSAVDPVTATCPPGRSGWCQTGPRTAAGRRTIPPPTRPRLMIEVFRGTAPRSSRFRHRAGARFGCASAGAGAVLVCCRDATVTVAAVASARFFAGPGRVGLGWVGLGRRLRRVAGEGGRGRGCAGEWCHPVLA